MVYVEVFRLFLVILGAIAGLEVGDDINKHGIAPVTSLALGAFIAYVVGGVVGRMLDRGMQQALSELRRMPPAEVFAASIVGTTGLLVGLVAGLPLVALVHSSIDYPAVAAFSWTLTAFGIRLGVMKGGEIVRAAGISRLVDSRTNLPPEGMLVVDTSAMLDRYLLVLGRAGLLAKGIVLPRFVIDEVRMLAEGPDPVSSRRARRGLEAVDVLRATSVDVRIDEEEIPELESNAEKVVALAYRLNLRLVTCSSDVVADAAASGVPTLDLRRLSHELTPDHPPGERLVVDLVKEGRQPRQAIGYLPEGDMVVVNDAAGHVGRQNVTVVVSSTRQTSQGQLVFAHLFDPHGDGATGAAVDDSAGGPEPDARPAHGAHPA